MADDEILFEERGAAGIITLNRPKALNALTRTMIADMHPRLAAWADDPKIERVVVKAAGERAFCAGGDIRQLYDWSKAGDPAILDFYREEYRLNTFIKRYPKPYVALIDGIVMGGGVGISVHGSHRVAGERLMFAMPETGIGLFPDVGGTFFLPRLPGRSGTWLALTGARLGQADALWSGLATHAAPSGAMADIEAALTEPGDTDAILFRHATNPDGANLPSRMPVIERCFAGDTVEEILGCLDADESDWAQEQVRIIRAKSPTSLKIALRQMQVGATADFETCMRTELRIVSRVLAGTEFFEGVRATIIDKDNSPEWQPPRLEEVATDEIDRYFAPLDRDLDLSNLDRG